MKRWEVLWLAFEKFAVFFSFMVAFILVMILLVVGYAIWQQLPVLQTLKDGLVCDTIIGMNTLLDDFENATITRTIPISQTIPVRFDLPLDKNLSTTLTKNVQLSRPTTFVFPAGGGQINGTVYLVLPKGQVLPVHMRTSVEVSHTLPVEMNVSVTIPLKETELGSVIGQLRDLLSPLRLEELERTLECKKP